MLLSTQIQKLCDLPFVVLLVLLVLLVCILSAYLAVSSPGVDWQRMMLDLHGLTKDDHLSPHDDWSSRTGMMIDLHGPTWDDTGSPRTGHGWQRMIPDRHGPTKDDAWSSRTGVHHRSCAYCSLCLLCVVCCVFSDIAHSTHAHNIIHLMMIIHGIQHGGLYFRWCSLLPKKARKMRRRRARSAFSLLTATLKPKKSLDENFHICMESVF